MRQATLSSTHTTSTRPRYEISGDEYGCSSIWNITDYYSPRNVQNFTEDVDVVVEATAFIPTKRMRARRAEAVIGGFATSCAFCGNLLISPGQRSRPKSLVLTSMSQTGYGGRVPPVMSLRTEPSKAPTRCVRRPEADKSSQRDRGRRRKRIYSHNWISTSWRPSTWIPNARWPCLKCNS